MVAPPTPKPLLNTIENIYINLITYNNYWKEASQYVDLTWMCKGSKVIHWEYIWVDNLIFNLSCFNYMQLYAVWAKCVLYKLKIFWLIVETTVLQYYTISSSLLATSNYLNLWSRGHITRLAKIVLINCCHIRNNPRLLWLYYPPKWFDISVVSLTNAKS